MALSVVKLWKLCGREGRKATVLSSCVFSRPTLRQGCPHTPAPAPAGPMLGPRPLCQPVAASGTGLLGYGLLVVLPLRLASRGLFQVPTRALPGLSCHCSRFQPPPGTQLSQRTRSGDSSGQRSVLLNPGSREGSQRKTGALFSEKVSLLTFIWGSACSRCCSSTFRVFSSFRLPTLHGR